MARRGHLKQRSLLRTQIDDLAAPAEAQDTPSLHAALFREVLDDFGDARQGGGGRSFGAEEGAEFLLFFLVIWGVPGDVCGFAFEEIGDDDLVGFRAGVGEDVGALEGLGEEAEDVVNDQDAAFGVGGAGDV